jgi:hypothetical protein
MPEVYEENAVRGKGVKCKTKIVTASNKARLHAKDKSKVTHISRLIREAAPGDRAHSVQGSLKTVYQLKAYNVNAYN